MTDLARSEDVDVSPMAVSLLPSVVPTFEFSPYLTTLRNEASVQAEAIRAMRTYVMAQHVGRGRRALSVCAATEGVGCSYSAINLAVSLSQIGVKTLFVDGDLRLPSLEQFVRPSRAVNGLAQHLSSSSGSGSAYIQYDVMDNLSLMYAGGTPTNPQELLAADRFQVIMDHCLRDYEMTIIDTPPAAVCADARRISSVVGYSLVVAKQHESRISDIRTVIGQLEQDGAVVIGSVMTEG